MENYLIKLRLIKHDYTPSEKEKLIINVAIMYIVSKDNALVNQTGTLVNPPTDGQYIERDIFIENGTLEQEQILCDRLGRSIKGFLSMIETDLELELTINN